MKTTPNRCLGRLQAFLLSLVCAWQVGCAANRTFAPVKQIPANHAVVYIYRPPNVARYSSVPICAETTLVEVFGRTYTAYMAKPGMAFFQPLSWATRPQAVLPVRLTATGTSYLRIDGPTALTLVSPEIAREEIAYCEQVPPGNDVYREALQRWSGLRKGMPYEEVLNLLRATGAEMSTPQRTAAPTEKSRFLIRGRMWPESRDRAGATQWTVVFEDGQLLEWTDLPAHPCDKGARRDIAE